MSGSNKGPNDNWDQGSGKKSSPKKSQATAAPKSKRSSPKHANVTTVAMSFDEQLTPPPQKVDQPPPPPLGGTQNFPTPNSDTFKILSSDDAAMLQAKQEPDFAPVDSSNIPIQTKNGNEKSASESKSTSSQSSKPPESSSGPRTSQPQPPDPYYVGNDQQENPPSADQYDRDIPGSSSSKKTSPPQTQLQPLLDSTQASSPEEKSLSDKKQDDSTSDSTSVRSWSKPTDSSGGGPRPARRKRGDRVTLTTARIGFIGAGKIADAIVRGLIRFGKVNPRYIYVTSKSGRSLDAFRAQGAIVSKRAYDIFGRFDCDVIFIATHGHVIRECYKRGGTRPQALTINYIPNQRHAMYLLSLAGGITTNEIKNTLLNPEKPEKYKLAMNRVMLNASVAYGSGVAAIDVEPDSRKFFPIIRDVISSIAPKIEYVNECNMDQVCAIAGNGLAFVFYYLSALADGGFKRGLSKRVAIGLAAKTLHAAGAALLESGRHSGDLCDSTTSPSGPAIYGLHILDQQDCASGISSAVEGAFRRIQQLSENPQ